MNSSQFIIEQGKRVSDSFLWQLQAAFYQGQGVAAWRDGTIPQYITVNPSITKVYAKMVFAWLEDLVRQLQRDPAHELDRQQPIYVLELGAGSGRFAFGFLRRFFAMLAESALRDLSVVYVMTDFSQANIDFWRSQGQLREWVDAGRLDFAHYEAGVDNELYLLESGRRLGPEVLHNPLAVIANYVFDSLAQDVFRVQEGRLWEGRLQVTSSQPELDLSDPTLLLRMGTTLSYHEVATPYYGEGVLDGVLARYLREVPDAYLLFPIGALRAVQSLGRLAGERMLILSADKGYHRAEDLAEQPEPDLDRHGSFSFSVNYHALGAAVEGMGGALIGTAHRHANLDVCAFLLDGQPAEYPGTRLAFRLNVVEGGPDDFFTLGTGVQGFYDELDGVQLLAYLRMSQWDPWIFLDSYGAIMAQVETASVALAEELKRGALEVWENYYHIGEDEDLAFALAGMLHTLGFYEDAVAFLEGSLALYGPSAETFANLAACYLEMGETEEAARNLQHALVLEPTLATARAMWARLGKGEWDGA